MIIHDHSCKILYFFENIMAMKYFLLKNSVANTSVSMMFSKVLNFTILGFQNISQYLILMQ